VFVETLDELEPLLRDLLDDGDLLLTMGAGDIGAWAAGLAERLRPANRLKVLS
jgi:UDP-N-acetylmuramate--alanine ligase